MKKIILWMLAAIIIVGGVFFIPEQSGSIWPSLLLSSTAALIYLVALCLHWLPEISSVRKRAGIIIMLLLLVGGSAFYGYLSYQNSIKQKDTLINVRTTIEEGVTFSRINKPLHLTLRDYYRVNDREASLGDLFIARYDSLISEDGKYLEGTRDVTETLTIYVSRASADSVVMIAESNYIKGRNPDFTNYSGKTGKAQTVGILTKKGIRYERTN